MYYVYILDRESESGYYIGYTNDLRRRFKEHCSGQKCKLIYYEAYHVENLARRREMKIKQFGGAWRSLRARLIGK